MTSIYIDGNIVAMIWCAWRELPLSPQTPHGLSGSSLAPKVSTSKVLRYSIKFEDQNKPAHESLSYNDAANTLITYLSSSFPSTSKIGVGCFLYGMGPMNAKVCKNRSEICLNVMRALIMVRDMFTDADMSRDEQGDPALDAIVKPDDDNDENDEGNYDDSFDENDEYKFEYNDFSLEQMIHDFSFYAEAANIVKNIHKSTIS